MHEPDVATLELPRGAVAAPTIRFVYATRHSRASFLSDTPLGRSLLFYRSYPSRQRIELRLFADNAQGLPAVYNAAIGEAAADPAVLVFAHDDLYLSDYFWAARLLQALERFDIVGLVGNRRRAPRQASWMYLDDRFRKDSEANLSGVI